MISHNLTRTAIRIAAMCNTAWLALIVVTFMLAPGKAGAQNVVTPTLLPAPPGKLIVVSNGPDDQTDPHVSGNLVSYSSQGGSVFVFFANVHYFDLSTGLDVVIPQGSGAQDFLSDVSGSTVVFNRLSSNSSSIFSFDTATVGAQPVEVSPPVQAFRTSPQIGGNTIAWEDHGLASSSINAAVVAYDTVSRATTVLVNDSTINQSPAISPDGLVIVWMKCATTTGPCSPWEAVLSNGAWTAQQVVSRLQPAGQFTFSVRQVATDGAIVTYPGLNSQGVSQLAWQPVGGGTEQVLNGVNLGSFGGESASGGLISFSGIKAGANVRDIYVYDVATNALYNVTGDLANAGQYPSSLDNTLSDISVTPDGKVRVVWQVQEADFNVYAYTFNLPVGDFSLGAIAPLTIAAGGSGSTNVAVNPVNGFSSAVSLSVTGQPAGVAATLTPSQVTPSGGNPASSVLNVNVADFVSPTNITLTVTGISGSQTHSATANITVIATESSIGNLISDLLNAGCIDNAGIGNALTSKLAAAQSAGNPQTAINTLTALKNQINAQAGKHIATSCMLAGVTINPVTALLLDVQSLIDSLRVSMTPDPITGYVDMNGLGVPGATVSIFDANGNAVATATTDITGFYFIATTGGVLTPGATYKLQVTGFLGGFANATPGNQTFTWQGGAITFSDFVLN
jgi:hypothetical protein